VRGRDLLRLRIDAVYQFLKKARALIGRAARRELFFEWVPGKLLLRLR
jgi:hypothetical protein